jgi:hypothetical protein
MIEDHVAERSALMLASNLVAEVGFIPGILAR